MKLTPEMARKLATAVLTHPCSTSAQLALVLGEHKARIYVWCKKLAAVGLMAQTGSGTSRTDPQRWLLPRGVDPSDVERLYARAIVKQPTFDPTPFGDGIVRAASVFDLGAAMGGA